MSFAQSEDDRLSAVDIEGHYTRMKLLWYADEARSCQGTASATQREWCVLSIEARDKYQSAIDSRITADTIRKHQFSRDGQILLRILSEDTYFEPEYYIIAIEVFKLGNNETSIIELDEYRRYPKGLPVLSENGEGVLISTTTKIR